MRAHGVQGVVVAPAADVWALGVTLYVLLSGLAPFVESNQDVVANILRGRVSFEHARWKTVSAEAKAFLTRVLAVDPAARPTLATIAADAWLRDVVVPAAPSGGRAVEADAPREQIVVLDPVVVPEYEAPPPQPKRLSSTGSTAGRKREREDSHAGSAAPVAPPAHAAPAKAGSSAASSAAAAAEPQTKKAAPALSASALRKLKVAEVRIECSNRGLPTTGTKDQMVARIVQFQEGK